MFTAVTGGACTPANTGAPAEASATAVPAPSAFTTAPLRNRIRVELRAPASDVWALVGDLARFPEYATGLDRVEPKANAEGVLTEYVCHFKPPEGGGDHIVHREIFRWYAPNRGWATVSEEPNEFGLANSLSLVTLEPSREGVVVTWDQYYDAENLAMNRAGFETALADIGDNLVRRFGGRLLERYVDEPVASSAPNLDGAEE